MLNALRPNSLIAGFDIEHQPERRRLSPAAASVASSSLDADKGVLFKSPRNSRLAGSRLDLTRNWVKSHRTPIYRRASIAEGSIYQSNQMSRPQVPFFPLAVTQIDMPMLRFEGHRDRGFASVTRKGFAADTANHPAHPSLKPAIALKSGIHVFLD